MFLWRNLLVVGAIFIAVTFVMLAVERNARHRLWLKYLLGTVLVLLAALMGPIPYSLTMIGLMAGFAFLVAKGVPPAASFLAMTAIAPMLAYNAGGVVGIKTIAQVTTPFVVGAAAIVMRLSAPQHFVRSRFQATDMTVLIFMLAYWYLIYRGSNGTSLLRHAVEIGLPLGGAYLAMSRGRIDAGLFILKIFALTAASLALVGILESFTFWPQFKHIYAIKNLHAYWPYSLRMGLLRSHASFTDPIAFSLFLSAALIAVWGLWIARYNRFITCLLGASIFGGMICTFARTGGVALVVGMGAFMLLRRRLSDLTVLAAIAAIGLFLNSYLPDETRAGSSNYRINLAPAVWRAIQDNPLIGNNKAIEEGKLDSMLQGQGIVDMVNTYLGFALDGGFLLLLTVIAVPVAAYLSARRYRRTNPAPDQALLAQVVLAQMIGLAGGLYFTSLTDKNLVYLVAFAGLVVGVTLNAQRRASEGPPENPANPLVAPPPLVQFDDLRSSSRQ